MTSILVQRLRARLSLEWLTPSQRLIYEQVQRMDGPPHRVVNVYGPEGCGKTFLAWVMERDGFATYCQWPQIPDSPERSRLSIDHAPATRDETRGLRPLVDKIAGMNQIILFTRTRVDEPALPSFGLQITDEDWSVFRANLYRHLGFEVAEANLVNFAYALADGASRE